MTDSNTHSADFYLKVEAINIYKTILDTEQLSVVRGSSYIIKHAINNIVEKYKDKLEVITTGGSIGVFKVKDGNNAHNLASEIRSYLINDPDNKLYHLFTFTVDTVEAKTYTEAKEKLFALGRFQQLRNISYPIPSFDTTKTKGICAYNGFLPAKMQGRLPGSSDDLVSDSVYARFLKGRDLRTGMYIEEISNEKDPENELSNYHFSSNLNELAGEHHNIMLSGKVAVIYIDGNGFSKAQSKLIGKASNNNEQIKEQKTFDSELIKSRGDYLNDLIQLLIENKACVYLNDDQQKTIRLETLLWGGDEMTIVVPAWMGVEVLQHFFKIFKDFKISGQTLTHAAGIVFCRASTPIQKSQDLARQLADNLKEQDDGHGRDYDMFDYAVLESVDYMTDSDINEFWKKQYKGLAGQRKGLHINPDAKLSHFDELLKALPRHAIYRLVELCIRHNVQQLEEQKNITQEDRLLANEKRLEIQTQYHYTDIIKTVKAITVTFDDKTKGNLITELSQLFQSYHASTGKLIPLEHTLPIFWLHLLELYDYISPEDPKNSNNGEDK